MENGQTVLSLAPAAQNRLGIAAVTLPTGLVRAERTAAATVLPAQDLVSFRSGYIAALAQVDITRAASAVANKEYIRLRGLYADDQNVSQKTVEAAEGDLRADQVRQQAAERQLRLQAAVLRQRWGPVVTAWALEDSAELARVLEQREWLVQLTMTPGTIPAAPPESVSLDLPGGGKVPARFVSASPQVDPRIQGLTYLYRCSAASGVSAGASLLARFPAGRAIRGVVVPGSAVVWSEGQAWVYEQLSAAEFARRTIPTGSPVGDGYILAGGFAPGTKIVVRGAQSLLSEELLLEGGAAAPGDTDPD